MNLLVWHQPKFIGTHATRSFMFDYLVLTDAVVSQQTYAEDLRDA